MLVIVLTVVQVAGKVLGRTYLIVAASERPRPELPMGTIPCTLMGLVVALAG